MADTQAPSETAWIYAIGDIHSRLDLLDRAIATGRLTCVALDEDGHRFSTFDEIARRRAAKI